MNIKRNPEELENMIFQLNNKLKIANAEIKKYHYYNGNNNTKLVNPSSVVRLRHADTIPLNNTHNTHLASSTHTTLKLMRKPYSLASETLKNNKSKSTLIEVIIRNL